MGILKAYMLRLSRLTLRLLQGSVFLATVLLCQPDSRCAETSSGEYSLKAAFIYNFSKFMDWPDNAFHGKNEFCIATLGRTPLDRSLAALSGRPVHGRTIVFRQVATAEEATRCQVLFIGRSELSRMDAILETLRDLPVLTIADRADFSKRGGMLTLDQENGRIVFDINYRETQRSRLKPSSQLMKLARKIYGRP